MGTAVAEVIPAPICPVESGERILRADAAPDLAAAAPLDDAAWCRAEVIGPLYLSGRPEDDWRRTEARLLYCQGTIYLGARCYDRAAARSHEGADVQELWRGDSLELFFSQKADSACPYYQVVIDAGGRSTVKRYLRASKRGDPNVVEQVGVPV